jgi:hypothetical protein
MESFIDTRSAAGEFRDSTDRAARHPSYCNGTAGGVARAVECAEHGFDLPQVAKFEVRLHIAISNYYIAICDCLSRTGFGVF